MKKIDSEKDYISVDYVQFMEIFNNMELNREIETKIRTFFYNKSFVGTISRREMKYSDVCEILKVLPDHLKVHQLSKFLELFGKYSRLAISINN